MIVTSTTSRPKPMQPRLLCDNPLTNFDSSARDARGSQPATISDCLDAVCHRGDQLPRSQQYLDRGTAAFPHPEPDTGEAGHCAVRLRLDIRRAADSLRLARRPCASAVSLRLDPGPVVGRDSIA